MYATRTFFFIVFMTAINGWQHFNHNSVIPKKISYSLKHGIIYKIALLSLSTSIMIGGSVPAVAASKSEEAFTTALSTIIQAKKILLPVKGYVENQAYDAARTNVNYIINQLQLEKAVNSLIKNSLDVVDDSDAIDVAQEASTRVGNTAAQLDSLIYTIVFIPSESGEITPSQEKYRKQAYDGIEAFEKDLNDLLQIGGKEDSLLYTQANAKSDASLTKLPKVLFKDKSKKSGI